MRTGFETKGKKGEESSLSQDKIIKKTSVYSIKHPLSIAILMFALAAFVFSIVFFRKPAKPVSNIKVNFQDSLTVPPDGWVADYGQALGLRNSANQGSGYVYGWLKRSDKTPFDFVKNGIHRNLPADILMASCIQMQGNNRNSSLTSREEGIWEVKVLNGNYDVTVTVGDGGDTNSKHVINVEGVNAIAGFVPTAANKFKTATVTVSVSDGYISIDALGGVNTKINTVSIHPAKGKRPSVSMTNPENTSVKVSENSWIYTTVLKLPNGGINNATVTPASVYLTEEETGKVVPSDVHGTIGGDSIALAPVTPLKMGTTYKFNITDAVKDTADSSFIPYCGTFTTGTNSTGGALLGVKFDKVELPNTVGQFSTLTIGPEGKLYALGIDGLIKRFSIRPDGTLETPELLYGLQDAYGVRTKRLAIGLTFDPSSTASNLVAWVTHATFVLQDGPDWDGRLSRLSGPSLAKVQDFLVGLPRSVKDHLTNSIAFGPDGALYFTQGSNTTMGSPDDTWGSRKEHLLSGSVLRLEVAKLKTLPLDVKTSEGGNYDPYEANAPLTIYASGTRNAYDLVWHSNGNLYVPTNGSAAGGNTPASKNGVRRPDGSEYDGPSVPALIKVQQTEKDFLFKVVKGGYYGHPNPVRGEYVMNGGNPTYAVDPAEISNYPVGTKPDANWRGYSFDFHNNTSPDGIIEYKSNTFNGALKGKLLVTRYSHFDDIITLTPGGTNNDITSATEGYSIKGFSGFVDPLDLIEDTSNGNIYVSEFAGQGKITLLRVRDNTITYNKVQRKKSLKM